MAVDDGVGAAVEVLQVRQSYAPRTIFVHSCWTCAYPDITYWYDEVLTCGYSARCEATQVLFTPHAISIITVRNSDSLLDWAIEADEVHFSRSST